MKHPFLQLSIACALLGLMGAAVDARLGSLKMFTSPKRVNRIEYVYMNGVGLLVGGRIHHCNGQKTEWGTTGVLNDVYLTPRE